ncbi:MAG: DUF4150 domain-containing protein [Pseudomonadota bacterium]
MANKVFANGREVACKAAKGKTICAFPDVCFTPPQTPATPPGVPIPYPNTGMASDTTSGSKKVKITKKEVILKNKSYFKTSMGDEAGSAPKKGVVTSKNKGKVYFKAWSMDVKVEGKNVTRHLDLTTNNHASDPGDTPPWPYIDTFTPPDLPKKPCKSSCPKKPNDDEYKKLRRKSPTSQAREDVNKVSPKKCAACGCSPSRLAADHIVPLKIMTQMPGFACLSKEDQKKVANTKENFVGLCTSCNSSKSDKLWHTWKGNKKKGLDWQSNKYKAVREKARKITNKSIKNLKNKIRALPCENG